LNRLSLLVVLLSTAGVLAQEKSGTHGAVATVHPIATDAAVEVYKRGGNAVDAAVAAALTLGVVDGHNSGIGGGCFMLIRLADGTVVALDGREMAPAAATRDMFIRDGKADTRLSQTGPLASGVPGSLAVYEHAIARYGKMKLRDHLLPAAAIAEQGFPINRSYAGRLRSVADSLQQFEASRALLLKPDGSQRVEGDELRQPDLADTYKAIAEHGIDYFYRGPFAQAVEKWMSTNGGLLTAADFAAYEMKQREPLVTRYRGYTIVGFPPPSSGGVHVAQILNMLEHFDLRELEQRDPAKRMHVIAEAMKLAFADRAYWLGDPDFVPVPRGLIAREYAAELAQRISLDRATEVKQHSAPPDADDDVFGKHTMHVATADAEGNWVALTATVNTAFGSKVVIPGTGVVMNNQMDDFAIEPGVPNHFGLIGSDANAVGPRKRPLSSMSPTIVLKDDEPILTLGAAGGPRIITQVVLSIVNHLDLGDDLPAALARPRFHHQWVPPQLWIERTAAQEHRDALEAMGHTLNAVAPAGATQAIARTADGKFVAVHDPRVQGEAAVHAP
jgi:gamma-glutamyltranspeptidase / glutathione hydrolase